MNFLTVDTFHQEIAKGGIKLVTFVNPGCQVCAIVYPNVEEAAAQYPDKLALYRVDAKADKPLMEEFSLNGVPQVLFFKEGRYIGKMAGPQDVEDYLKKIEEII